MNRVLFPVGESIWIVFIILFSVVISYVCNYGKLYEESVVRYGVKPYFECFKMLFLGSRSIGWG